MKRRLKKDGGRNRTHAMEQSGQGQSKPDQPASEFCFSISNEEQDSDDSSMQQSSGVHWECVKQAESSQGVPTPPELLHLTSASPLTSSPLSRSVVAPTSLALPPLDSTELVRTAL